MIADDTDREPSVRTAEDKAANAASADGPTRSMFGPEEDRGQSVSSEASERGQGFRSDYPDWSASRIDGTDQGTSAIPDGPRNRPSDRLAPPTEETDVRGGGEAWTQG